MFDHILIALDGSDEARSAGALGIRVAHHMRARVTGLSVIDVRAVEGPAVETLAPLWGEVTGRPFQPELMRLYRERADSVLGDFCAQAEVAGLGQIERHAEVGVAEDVILQHAAGADLLVMGRRGEHAVFGRQVVGATSWKVLHRSAIPVLLGRKVAVTEIDDTSVGGIPRLPLVAWDGSPGAGAALRLAIGYAAATDGALRLVHAGRESADVRLGEANEVIGANGLEWESARLDVQPADAIQEAQDRWDTDCLFMGAFGRGRLRDLLFGSHTADILERVSGPVFVVP